MKTHYNYEIQAWIENGNVAECGHRVEVDGCTACYTAGMTESAATRLLTSIKTEKLN